uniref:translation initiation factor IF-2 n=1 Tax=Eubacterium cellulosolvens TaxID=29322 RepID=UPI000485BCDC|nr:translation initiation factor IF-2 [[Eubacterium] cellulosolvens]
MRVHELAKELSVDAKRVLEELGKKGITGKTAASGLEEDQIAAMRAAIGGAKPAQAKADAEKTEEAPKKKKRLIAVFHPQNASSKEGKTFRQATGKSKEAKKDKDKAARPAAADRARRGTVTENSRGGRPVGGHAATAGTPLVKVPRPHPVVHVAEPEKPETKPAQTANNAAQETASPAPAQTEPKAAAAEVKQKEETKKVEATTIDTSKSAGESTRTGQENRNGQVRVAQSRPNGGSAQRTAGTDRSGQGKFGGDRGGARGGQGGARPFGDRNGRPGQGGARPFGDRNGRPGQGGGRPGFGNRNGFAGNRPGAFNGGKDEDEGTNRFANRSHGQHSDHRSSAGGGMDMGLKKTSRDGSSFNKDKERSKQDLKSNKFQDGRNNGHGPNRNNRRLVPKALQKPVHKKEEKKEEKVTEIKIPDKLTIKELAEKMKMQPSVIVKDLFMKGEMFTVNQEVDYEKAEEIAITYEILCDHEEKIDVIAEMLKEEEEDESTMVSRPPVVCVMGHVDHGKTSLLDAIRNAHVTAKEAGGITQNIGAYGVKVDGKRITFLDTPGHEAFTAMRMRGANSTDIAVLVVAADDGVMPQTIEAINHAKAAGVEIIVAINKVDKPGANIDRVKQELTEYGLIASDWGGSTEMVPVSAKAQTGIDDLLETILLTAEILELKANPDRLARGLVLEAKLDKGKGPVANLLVQKGTLHVGDYIACGPTSGKVRAMTDETGRRVKEAGPSTPIEIQGLDGVPDAGEILVAMETDKEAKNFAATYVTEHKNQLLEETKSRMSLDALFGQIQDGSVKELELVVKADVQGSVEALKQSLLKLSNEEVIIRIIHSGVGAINESDVTLAAASNAIVIGFNVRPDQTAKSLADEEKIDIRLYRVIYQAIEDIENAMKGMLEPIYEEKVTGHAEVRQLFKASGIGTIAGSMVLDGSIQRGCKVRITRDGKQIFEGPLASLKRFKDDVKEVKLGYECGLVFEGFNEISEGDQVEAYIMVEVPR